MNLRQAAPKGQAQPASEPPPPTPPNPDRFLTLAIEGAALGVVEVDADIYVSFAPMSPKRCSSSLIAFPTKRSSRR
jgi:hypothetical protein